MSTDSPSSPDSPRRRSRWWRWLRDLLLLVVIVLGVQWWQSRHLVSGAAPPLVGLQLDGQPFQLDPARGPWLVHFWASWCPVCRLEQGNIASIAADAPVMTVATTSGTADEVRAFLAEQSLQMPVLMDEAGVIARQWGVNGVPATYVIDRDGNIRFAGMGYSTELGLRLRLWLAGG